MRTSVNISFFVSPEPAASTASKKDYRSTAYNNYCIKSAAPRHCSSELDDAQVLHDFSADLVDLDNEVYTFEVEARTESEASELSASPSRWASKLVTSTSTSSKFFKFTYLFTSNFYYYGKFSFSI